MVIGKDLGERVIFVWEDFDEDDFAHDQNQRQQCRTEGVAQCCVPHPKQEGHLSTCWKGMVVMTEKRYPQK